MRSHKSSLRSHKSSEREHTGTGAQMSLTYTNESLRVEAQDRVRDLVRHSGACLKAAFDVVGRRLGGMSPGRVRQFYYGSAKSVHAAEMDHIRQLHGRFSALLEQQRVIEARMREVIGNDSHRHMADGALHEAQRLVAEDVPAARPDPRPDCGEAG